MQIRVWFLLARLIKRVIYFTFLSPFVTEKSERKGYFKHRRFGFHDCKIRPIALKERLRSPFPLSPLIITQLLPRALVIEI